MNVRLLKSKTERDLDFLYYGHAYARSHLLCRLTSPLDIQKICLTLLVCSAQTTLRQARWVKYLERNVKSDYFVMTLSVR